MAMSWSPTRAQEISIWVGATAGHARPPASPAVDATTFGLLTGRLHAGFDQGSATANAQLGSAVAGPEGRWAYGDVTLSTGRRLGPVDLLFGLTGFGLHYLEPFTYDVGGLELRSALSGRAGAATVIARPHLLTGGWSTSAADGDLAIAGGDLIVQRSFGAVTASVSGGARSVDNGVTSGAFVRAGVDAAYSASRWTVTARLESQRTPMETELGGGVGIVSELRPGLLLYASAGRHVRDPRFGTPGTVAVSVGMAVRPVHWSAPAPAPIASVGDRRAHGRLVTFTLQAPEAMEVAVAGDFSGWEPLLMERTRNGWRLETVLPPGLHNFAFLVDGVWALPPDAPGVTDDGWGRKNASLVVEP